MDQNMADSSALAQLFLHIYRSPKVIIAQVEGDAFDSGCGLITVCDFVFAVPLARFGFTEVKMGWAPALIMPFLLRKIGETRCKELLLSGETISGQQAQEYHLINRIVPQGDIQDYVKAFAQNMCRYNSPASLQLTKKMIADIQDFPMENAIKFAAKMNAYSRATDDSKRGIEATLNQDEIQW
jgi:methylglutaconyl-CoA hydratase